ncbi:MAG: hypothetical protein JO197_06410 [Acidobacteria bacterium]|nr:hypothetical protein [Acidobacteriota bacterium]
MNRLAAVALLFISGVVKADVRVTFTIDSRPMKALYASAVRGAKTADQEIADALLPELHMRFPQWRYVTTGPAISSLDFHVQSKATGEHTFSVVLTSGNRITRWNSVWLTPGELDAQGGYPARAQVGTIIAARVAEKLLDANQQAIFENLRDNVPVVMGGQWLWAPGRREEPRIVLPLRWTEAKFLSASAFRVVCDWPNKQMKATLRSQALSVAAIYEDKVSRARYEALALRPLRRIVGEEDVAVGSVLREMDELTPFAVFLQTFDPAGLQMAGGTQ